jgi:hypothetical protein
MNIDLDLSHYSMDDLHRFFEVKSDCTSHELDQKESNLLSRLIHISMENSKKKEIESFVRNAKEKLIIPKQVDPFHYSKSDNYFKGKVNPVDTRVLTKIISIDTLFRPNYKMTLSTDFIYQFPEYHKNVVSMSLRGIEIPKTWYLFSAPMNTFLMKEGTDEKCITIGEGNYTPTEFNAMPPVIPFAGGTMIVSTTNQKTMIQSDNKFTVDFSPTTGTLQQSCGWTLGFRLATYESEINTSGKHCIVSEGSFGSTDNYFFLEIDDFQNNFMTDLLVSTVTRGGIPSFLGNNIIARIQTNNTLIVDSKLEFTRDYFGPVTLEKLRIRLLNRFGEVVSLHSNDMSFSIGLKELYS